MNGTTLIERIHEALQPAEEKADRHIVRFASPRLYRRCLALVRKHEKELPLLSSLRPLKMVQGFVAPLGNVELLLSLQEIAAVEEDRKRAFVHGFAGSGAYSLNPSAIKKARGKPFVPWGVTRIRAPEAWKRSTGARVKIGVIDTGIDFSHPDLQHAIGGGINLINRHMLPIDDNGHGTHISGTIAAASQQAGIIGVAPHASIYAVKAFDHNGNSYVSDIIQGIEWCVRNRIDVINMSFGMKTRSSALEEAVRAAYRAGVVIVASSGNEGRKGFVDYPARFSQTIAVGATTKGQRIAPFCNKGRQIDIYAPGEKIISTWVNGKYNELSGTSMATSHVSGVIALLLSLKPRLTPRQVKLLLKKNATLMPGDSLRVGFPGEVHAFRTVRSIRLAAQRS